MIDILQWRVSRSISYYWCYTSTRSTLLNLSKTSLWFFVFMVSVANDSACYLFKWTSLLLLLSGDIELNPGPINDKPTIPLLTQWLAPLVEWQEFGQWLPLMTPHEIQMIEANGSTVRDKKRALYNKWLAVHPEATWKEVVTALEKIEENQLAQDITTKCCQVTASAISDGLSQASPTDYDTPTASGLSVTSQKESIAFPTKEQEIEVKQTLEKLEKKFSSLFIQLQSNLDEIAKSPNVFNRIIRWMKIRTRRSHELSHIKTLDDAFEIIQPYFDFIDCRLIVDLSEEFLIEDKKLVTELKEYKKEVDFFCSSFSVSYITSALRIIFKDHVPDFTNMPQIHLLLHNNWLRSNINCLSLLIRHSLPVEFQQSIMKYITITMC